LYLDFCKDIAVAISRRSPTAIWQLRGIPLATGEAARAGACLHRPQFDSGRIFGGEPAQGQADSAGCSGPGLLDMPEVALGRCARAQQMTLYPYYPPCPEVASG